MTEPPPAPEPEGVEVPEGRLVVVVEVLVGVDVHAAEISDSASTTASLLSCARRS